MKKKNNILIIVDMQNDFINGTLGTPEAQAIVNNVIREINSKDYNYIYCTLDTHYSGYYDTLEGKNLPVKHCILKTTGWSLNNKIEEALKGHTVITKVIKNTFGSIYLPGYVAMTNPDSITICGLCTDVCVISNALMLRAYFYNTPMYYIEDACAGTTPEKHEAACKIMESCQIFKK